MTRVKRRPCWAVLAPKQDDLEAIAGGDDGLEVVRGTKQHDAILQFEPGSESSGEEELAQAVSRSATEPAYVLWLHPDYPRVQAFERGEYAGDITAWPDSVAQQLGCTFPTIDGRGKADLTPHKAPAAEQGELTLCGWTVRQWKHMMTHELEWSVMLDGAGVEHGRELLAATSDERADVRAVACKLLEVVGYIGQSEFGLGELAATALARLRELEAGDRHAEVRAAAAEAAESLAESIERYAAH